MRFIPGKKNVFFIAGFVIVATALPAYAAPLQAEDFESLAPALQPASHERIPAEVLGWTHTAPEGWSVDTGDMDTAVGVEEWRGWCFTTLDFWARTDAQGREQFVLAEGVFAVAESDEYDDRDNPPPLDSNLVSPTIRVPAGKSAYVKWDNFHRKVKGSTSQFLVSINGAPDQLIKDYSGLTHANVEELIKIEAPAGNSAWTLVMKWRYRAKNGWFWAIDNLRVFDAPPPPPPPVAPLGEPEDWPTYRRDGYRSGTTDARVDLPLNELWTHRARHAPRPAWPGPAREDVSHRVPDLSPTHTFDRAYHVAVSGGRLYYGSSADDSVHGIDTETGEFLWSFTSGGPVRLAPTVTAGRVYAGSDDGHVYCLDAHSGAMIWKYRAAPEKRYLPGNGRMISRWPVRSGVAIVDGIAYCTAGIFPLQGVYLCAFDAEHGNELWRERIEVSSQGHMLATSTRLFVPTGRTAPAAFIRKNGKALGGFEGIGGCFAFVLEDMLVHGPGERGHMHVNAPGTREKIVSTPGLSMVADGSVVYILKPRALVAFDRGRYLELSMRIKAIEDIDKNERSDEQNAQLRELGKQRAACERWKTPCDAPYELVLAGETLFAGGEGQVFAYNAEDGELRWSHDVDGKAHGLAISRGCLYVSTDKGTIHCFGQGQPRTPSTDHLVSAEPASPGAFAAAAERVLEEGHPTTGGYALLLGVGDGGFLCDLALQSRLRVIGVDSDPNRVAQARARLKASGLYSTRAVVHHCLDKTLPYPGYFANLVVVQGDALGLSEAERERVLCPFGGVEFSLTDTEVKLLRRREPLKGMGEWTHTYAEPGNSSCSNDTLVAAPLEMQWFGQPGPRTMIDRHFRNVPPLFKDGRLFVPGNEVVYCMDAYNGTVLWRIEIPGSRRVGVFLDSSNMVVDEANLFLVAEAACHRFDAKTGEEARAYPLPGESADTEWGYLARPDGLLLGSSRSKGATYDTITRSANLETQAVWYPNMKVAVSRSVFALDPETGETAWTHESGRLIDTTFAVGNGRLFFVESHSPAALADETGRLRMLDLIDGGGQYLVALDLASGAVAFKQPLDMSKLQQPSYLNCAEGTILLSGGRIAGGESVTATGRGGVDQLKGGEAVRYSYYAFDAASGDALWQREHASELNTDGGHGEYNRHPTIIDDIVYAWPYAYRMKDGEQLEGWKFDRRGHGCGGIAASQHGLYWRGHNPWMYDLRPGGGPMRVTLATRPGCWINMIPAGGLLLIPEASSGCTCGYSMQTSLAFAPAHRPAP